MSGRPLFVRGRNFRVSCTPDRYCELHGRPVQWDWPASSWTSNVGSAGSRRQFSTSVEVQVGSFRILIYILVLHRLCPVGTAYWRWIQATVKYFVLFNYCPRTTQIYRYTFHNLLIYYFILNPQSLAMTPPVHLTGSRRIQPNLLLFSLR